MDLEPLLSPRSDDAPSGENLEYDPSFMNLEIAAMPGEERQVGDTMIPAEEPDHKEVSRLAQEVLEQSHDIRAAVYLANSSLHLGGMGDFAECLAYIAGCLEQNWETCHPELDEDDGDPTMRVNAVLTLTDQQGVLRSLRMTPLTQSRMFGRLSYRDIQVADGEISAPADMENLPDTASVSAAFQDTEDEVLAETLVAARRADEMLGRISAAFDEQVPGQGPTLDPLEKVLKAIVARLAAESGGEEEAADPGEIGDDEAPIEGSDAPAPAAAAAGPSGGGTIRNTNDVKAAIDRIIDYYQRTEPSSPVPIILHRARKLVDADFMEILKDMVPESVEEIQRLGGFEPEEEEY